MSQFFFDTSNNAVNLIASATTITISEQIYNDCVASVKGGGTLSLFQGDVLITMPALIQTLAQQQQANIAVLQAAYQTAINAPVTFKNSAGITSAYTFGNSLTHGGTNAQTLLTQILSAGSTAWTAGVWFDVVGVAQAMTFADLQGLALAVEAMETPDEQHLMVKIAAVQAQTSLPYVVAVW